MALVWAGRCLKWAYARFKPEVATGGWRHYLLAPLILAALIAGESRDLPLRSVFALHRPALTRFSQRVLAQDSKAPVPQPARVGLYRLTEIKRLHGGVRFVVAESSFLGKDFFGFAFSPGGKTPRDISGSTPVRLSQNWFWWTRSESWD